MRRSEVQKDTNLERVETEAVAVEHLPGESVARWKGGRVELEQLPGERSKEKRNLWREKGGAVKWGAKPDNVANFTVMVITANMHRLFTLHQAVDTQVLYAPTLYPLIAGEGTQRR